MKILLQFCQESRYLRKKSDGDNSVINMRKISKR